ncbi:ribosomal RNA processing protein 1 homolog B isoform 3-T3 [Menidia menidia]
MGEVYLERSGMAAVQEPEVQLAQRLASNEKPVRTRAMKKLRKYISVRSQREAGGFSAEELLKLWKGLFYCLWMQDKPLLQEELSNQISTMIHSFHDTDGQLLYLESFLQTFKREWTGIDRLRMDKFFQLVRFMFRQTFEALKRKHWDDSVVSIFLELLMRELLRNGSEAPCGLQLHILDLYLGELAAVGSAELSADQNLRFIEPFCKQAAKTKDQTLFRAICSSIFSTIIDQAPFAIEDLMKEVKASEVLDSDSGRESEEDGEFEEEKTRKQMNGSKSNKEDGESDDERLHGEDSDSELPQEDDIGPVLQFDYTALADKLFELASRSSTPGQNRQRLYKIIKALRDLSEGIFPQGDYPEEVSTDEDDEMFGSRKRMKRAKHSEDVKDRALAGKRSKAHTGEEESLNKKNHSSEPADRSKKKKRKKKKKVTENGERLEQKQTEALSVSPQTEEILDNVQDLAKEVKLHSSVSPVKVTEDPSERLLLSDMTTMPPEGAGQPALCKGKAKNRKKGGLKAEAGRCETSEKTTITAPETAAPAKSKGEGQGEGQGLGTAWEEVGADSGEGGPIPELDKIPGDLASNQKTSKKKKKQHLEATEEQTAEAVSTDTETPPGVLQHTRAVAQVLPDESSAPEESLPTQKKKRMKNQGESAGTGEAEKLQLAMNKAAPTKKKKKSMKLAEVQLNEIQDEMPDTASLETEEVKRSGKAAKKKRKIPVEFEFEADELAGTSLFIKESSAKKRKLGSDVSGPASALNLKAQSKMAVKGSESGFITFQNKAAVPTPLFCKTKTHPSPPTLSKKKNRTLNSQSKKVTFGLKNNKTAEFRKTDVSLLLSPDGSSRVPFDPQQRPKYGVLKSPTNTLTHRNFKKTSSKTQKGTPKQRPSAADFF